MLSDFNKFVESSGINSQPRVQVKISERCFPVSGKNDTSIEVIYIDVDMSVGNEASICNVVLQSKSHDNFEKNTFGKVEYDLDDNFNAVKIGSKMEVYMGRYKNDLLSSFVTMPMTEKEKVWEGYISGFEYEIQRLSSGKLGGASGRDVLNLTIHGMDGKIWLMASKKSDLKKGIKKYTKAISSVLTPYYAKFVPPPNIKVSGEPSFKKPIYQDNQSDYEFICECAKKLGAWFFISKGKLNVVRPTEKTNPQTVTIEPSGYVDSLKLSTNIVNIPKSISVLGFNDKKPKNPINAEIKSNSSVGSGQAPSSLTTSLSSQNKINIVNDTVTTSEEAKFLAQSEFILRSMELCDVELKVYGVEELLLFAKVNLKNWGSPIDNTYVVTGIEHHYDYFADSFYTVIHLSTDKYTPQKADLF